MKFQSALLLAAGAFLVCVLFLVGHASPASVNENESQTSKILIDYPLTGSIFPPEITPPTFLFRDTAGNAKTWLIEVRVKNRPEIRVQAATEPMRVGELDPEAGPMNELLELTAQQKATRIWRPDDSTWARIKQASVKSPATITITGFADDQQTSPVSIGSVTISTSTDPVGAPIFYRDVPLMLWPKTEKGAIQPLPPFAIPL